MPNQYRTPRMPDPFGPVRDTTGFVVGSVGRLVGTVQEPTKTAGRVATAVVPGLGGLDDAVSRAGAWASDRNNWVRVAKVVGGLGLIVVGLAQLAVKPAAQVAGAVAPVGKLAKGLK